MAEYIERGALKEYLYGGKFQDGCTGCDEPGEGCIECIVDEIDSFPAVDVAPVRRGQWLDLRGDYQTAKCSFCASQYEVTFGEKSNGMLFDCFKRSYKYCPNCGAKMDVGNG